MEREEVAGRGRLAEGRQAAGHRLRGREAGSAAEVIQGEGEARLRAASSPGLAPLHRPGHRPFVSLKTAAWNRTVTPHGSRGGPGHPTPAGTRRLRRHKRSTVMQRGVQGNEKEPGSPNPLFLFL